MYYSTICRKYCMCSFQCSSRIDGSFDVAEAFVNVLNYDKFHCLLLFTVVHG